MKIANMRHYDVANGPGIRCTIFVSGCTHNCKGCFNKPYQDFEYGETFSSQIDTFIEYAKDPRVSGVTILGGEPFDQDEDMLILVSTIKRVTGKSIWIFSGYLFEKLLERPLSKEILKHCDVLVDGPFVEELKDLKLRFKGSSNQRTIDIQESFKANDVVLYKI